MSDKNSEGEFEKRETKIENKISGFLKTHHNIELIGILILGFIIRIYYFIQTKDQALWWDSASYGILAKNLVTHAWNNVGIVVGEISIRPPLFPFFWSLLLRMNAVEITSKFILEFIPSTLSIFFVYLIAKKVYNKRIALISAFILAVSWLHLFYTMRLLTSVPALLFSLISIYLFFKATESEKISLKYFSLSTLFLFLSAFTRWSFGLVGITYILYLIFTTRLKFLKQKNFWLGGVIGALPLILLFWKNFISAVKIYTTSAGEKGAYAFYTIDFFSHILRTPFLIFFILGLLVVFAQLIMGVGLISKIKKLKTHLFLLILMILNLCFLIFFIKYSEDRYLMECFISILFIIAIGIDFIYLFIKKYNKPIAVIFIILLLFSGAYSQIKFGDGMINSKKSSFYQMKEAFLWTKDNTPEGSTFLSRGIDPWAIYYGDRMPINFDEIMVNTANNTDQDIDFDYLVVHVFTSYSSQAETFNTYLSKIQPQLLPVAQFFFDSGKQQPAVFIYRKRNTISDESQ